MMLQALFLLTSSGRTLFPLRVLFLLTSLFLHRATSS